MQKDRVAAAACFLPLTTTAALARDLGTRHRAAIGITEETDCLSIVVSEETGLISVCAFGELVRGLSLAEVRERINRHFESVHPGSIRVEESPADIPLASDGAGHPAESRPNERVNQP
ncbi:MAG: DNA integrity scanning protein DisA nucleotide-binding domain protein [Ignavibacteriota bacterium]